MPENLDAIRVIILFIIPGFISQYIIGSSIPRRHQSANGVLLEAILFSCINYALFGWPLLLAPGVYPKLIEQHAVWVLVGWATVLLITPIGIGLIFSWLINKQKLTGLYGLLGLRYTDPIPRAWDYYFGQRKQGWVRVTFNDGTMIAGFLGTQSFASSFPSPEDLYLEKVYQIDENGVLSDEPLPGSGGVWIQGNQIKFMEFINIPEGE